MVLNHPRPGIMNHQPQGPSCFMSCVIAIQEFYSGSILPLQGRLSPVQSSYINFERYHADATIPKHNLKHALNMAGHYDGELDLRGNSDEMKIYRDVITLKIISHKPILCGIRKKDAHYGHVFMIYGYTLPNRVLIADPAFGLLNMPISEVRSGYNGDSEYKWEKMLFTKR